MNRFILSYLFFIGLIFGIGKSEAHLQINKIYTIDKIYYNDRHNQLGAISEINDSSITFVWNGISIVGKKKIRTTTLLFQNIDRIVFEPMFYEEAPLLLFCAAIPASAAYVAINTLLSREGLVVKISPAWFFLPIISTISYIIFQRKIINDKTIDMNDWDLSNKKLFFKNIFSIHNDIYMNKYLKNKYLNDLLLGYKN